MKKILLYLHYLSKHKSTKALSLPHTFYLFLLMFTSVGLQAQDSKKVLIIEIRETIDPRMSRYVELALTEARETAADAVIIDMDTYGGAVNDADKIRTLLLDFPKPVYVFINKNAASAGALISIACDSIYMAKGANIGAATVVNGGDGAKAPDKYQSYMRGMMRSTAEAKGRNPQIAEAMVDENIEVPQVSKVGQVITFSTSEALKYGFCEAQLNVIEEVLERNNLANAQIIHYELPSSEKIIALFLNPFVSSILILVIIGGIYYELQTPGLGFPIAAALIASLLYFTPYYLNGLAANWEIIAFCIGLFLLGLEIFVIPGFGIAGIAGISITLGSLILVMLDNDWFNFDRVGEADLSSALIVGIVSCLGAGVLIILGLTQLTRSSVYKKIALQDTQKTADGYTSNFNEQNLMDLEGIAYTVLRPSGKVMIENEIYDAYTRGSFIEKGTAIKVIGQSGSAVQVKAIV